PSIASILGVWRFSFTTIVARTAASRRTVNKAAAARSGTPGFTRPITRTHHKLLFVSNEVDVESPIFIGAGIGCRLKGKKTSGDSCAEEAPVKPPGVTPMLVIGFM